MTRIKIGIMGCASIAKRSMIPAIKSLPDKFDLVAIASRTADKASAFAHEFHCKAIVGYAELLKEDIDAVYIPLPTGMHDEWINRSLMAGKHVYAEKSIASSFESACRMVENARKNKLALMEGFMFQYHTQHQFVNKLISDGEIGEVRCFRSSFGFPPLPPNNFRYDNEIGGGVIHDAAGYTVRATHFLLGNDFEVVASSLFFDEKWSTFTYGTALLKGKNGISAHVAFGFDNFYQCNYEIWGSKGKIIADRAFTPGPDFAPTIVLENNSGRRVFTVEKDNHFLKVMDAFYRLTFDPAGREKNYDEILLQSRSLQRIVDLA